MSSLLGPGLTKSMEFSGIDQLTAGRLRQFVDRLENVPDDAEVEISTSAPDRPGERRMWMIAVHWRDEEVDQ